MLYRFGFQVTGTLVMFILLWILLLKLPESGGSLRINSTMTPSCDDVSSLNSGDAKVFWVSKTNLNKGQVSMDLIVNLLNIININIADNGNYRHRSWISHDHTIPCCCP